MKNPLKKMLLTSILAAGTMLFGEQPSVAQSTQHQDYSKRPSLNEVIEETQRSNSYQNTHLFNNLDLTRAKTNFSEFPNTTVGHAKINMERVYGATDQDAKNFDELIKRITQNIPSKSTYTEPQAKEVLTQIHENISKAGYPKIYRQTQHLLFEALRKENAQKGLNCESRSVIYLSAAERLNLPLNISIFPGHMFVQWKLPDGNKLNWETLESRVMPNMRYESMNENSKEIIPLSNQDYLLFTLKQNIGRAVIQGPNVSAIPLVESIPPRLANAISLTLLPIYIDYIKTHTNGSDDSSSLYPLSAAEEKLEMLNQYRSE